MKSNKNNWKELSKTKAGQKLLENEVWFRTLFENVPVGVGLSTADGRVIACNEAMCRMTGYSEEELRHIRMEDTYHDPGDRQMLFKKLSTEKAVRNLEIQRKRKDGTNYLVSVTVNQLSLGGESVILTIAEDITERSRAEEALKKYSDQLERMVEERTAELETINQELQQEITERKRAEKELMLLSNAVKMSTDSIVISDLDGKIVDVNEATMKMYGTDTKGDLIGKNTFDLIEFEDRKKALEGMETALKEGYLRSREYHIIAKNGRKIPVEMSAALMKDASGKPIGFVGISRDITERKKTEQALRESEERLKLVLEGAELGTWDQDMKTGEVVRNRRWAEMLGYTLEEIESHKEAWKDLVHPDDFPEVNRLGKDHEDGRMPFFKCEHRMRTKSGQWKWILNCGKIIQRDKDGRPIRATGTHADITERKKMEEALRESEQRYRELVETSIDMIFTLDPKGNFRFTNKAWKKRLEYSDEETKSINGFDLIHPDDVEATRKHFGKVLEGEIMENVEFRSRIKDGSYIHVLINGSPILDYQGKVVAVLGVAKDITERKRAEEALRQEKDKAQKYLDVAGAMILAIDADQRVTLINKRGCEVLGYKESEIAGKKWFDTFLPERVRDEVKETFEKMMSGEIEPAEYAEGSVLTKSGEERIIAWHNVILSDDKGSITGTIISGEDITERKRAEGALRESEERYRTLFEDSPISLWEEDFSEVKRYVDNLRDSGIIDIRKYLEKHPEGVVKCADLLQITDVNKASLELYKARNKEELKSGLNKIFARESYHTFGDELVFIAEGKISFEKETIIQNLKGEKNHVVMRWTVAPGHEQTLSKVLVSMVDVTERKRAEEILRESEEKWRSLVENAPNIILLANSNGTIQFINRTLPPTTIEETIGKSIYDHIEPQYHHIVRETAQHVFQTGEPGHYEIMGVGPHGITSWYDTQVGPIMHDGKVVAITLISTDITERKQAEETLRREHDFSQSILETANSMIVCLDGYAKITVFNQECERVTGYRREEVLGKVWPELFLPPDQRHAELKSFAKWVRAHPSDRYEGPIVTKSGEIRTILWSNTAILGSDEMELVAIAIGYDITERKRMEKEAIQHTKNIEFLSKTAMEFMELPAEKDIYRYIGERLRELIGDAIYILVNSFDQKTRKIQARVLLADDQYMQVVSKTLGADLMGMSFVISDDAWNGLTSGKLVCVPGGIHELSFGEISKAACDALEKLAGTGDIFVMGFTKKEELYGSATIIMREGCELRNSDIVETFIRQAGVALQRRWAEEALKESEEKYRSLVELANDGIAIIQRLELRYVNPHLAEMLGYSVGEMIGSKATDFAHPDKLTKLVEVHQRRIAGQDAPRVYETVLVTKDGRSVNVEVNAGAITYQGERAALVMYRDITERKRAEEALRESEKRYREFADSLPQIVCESDQKGNISFVNRNAYEYLGYSAQELAEGFNIFQMLVPEDRKRAKENVRRRFKGAMMGPNEYTALRKDGSTFPVIIHSSLVVPHNEITGIRAIVVDITERTRAEEALRASENKYRILLENLPQKIFLKDKNSVYLSCNENYARDLNIKPVEIGGKTDYDFYPKELAEKYRADDKRILESGKTEGIEEKYIQDGQEVIVQTVKTLVKDEEGNIVALLGVFWDITEKKKMEAQLIQSERLAAVGTLAYGIAHEFNNVLAGILGNAEYGMGSDDAKETAECFKIIVENCDRAKSITNHLLAFSRQREVKKERADVTQAIENVLGLVERELEKQNITIVQKFNPIPEIVCDLGEISEVALNMITNAKDAMKPKGGTLIIESCKKKDNIEIIFTDTGCGIPDSIKSRMFEPFVTTKGPLGQSETPGTGLGLFLSYGIVKRYQGEIEVKSQVGKGSTFTIRIPISLNQMMPEPAESEPGEPTVIPRNLSVLLIDDETPILSVIRKFLEADGHSVTSSTSGKKGLKLFKKESFDLVLSDITMPDMDGIKLISKIKSMDPRVKLITLTGHVADEKLKEAKNGGADRILIKPFKKEDLYRAISQLLSRGT